MTSLIRRHPIFAGSLVLIGLGLLLVFLIRSTDKVSYGWVEKQIGVIEVQGIILDPLPVVEQIRSMEQLDHVAGVVVRIESPGGSVAAAQEIHESLMKLRGEKTVHASLGSVGASGGYYIACAADKIIANPGTLTGSIGVLLEWVNVKELGERAGVELVSIKSGRFKNVPSLFEDLSNLERDLLRKVVDDTHEQFVHAVHESRSQLQMDRIRELADGRVFTGRQALEVGLVDDLGGYAMVVDSLAQQLGIPGTVEVLRLEKEQSTFAGLLSLDTIKQWLPNPLGSFRLNYLLQ